MLESQRRDLFFQRLEHFGDTVALRDDLDREVTYDELAKQADQRAVSLPEARSVIAVLCSNSIETIVDIIACWRSGHVALLLSDRIALEAVSIKFPVALTLDHGVASQGTSTADLELHTDLCLLLSTSGSTGSTKLVRLSTTNLEANARSIAKYIGVLADDRAVTSLPLNYSYGLSVITSHLFSGATLLVTERSVSEPQFLKFCTTAGATSLAGVPYTYELLDAAAFWENAPRSLKTLTQAGGRLSAKLTERVANWSVERGIRFFVMYGQTEATARIAYVPPERLIENIGSIGIAIPEGELKVDAPDSEVGELVYRGPNVMMGYALDAADLRKSAEVTELRTGDLARLKPNGLFEIVGRASRFVKLFGTRVSLDEIEALVARDGIFAAATGTDEFLALAVQGQIDPTKVSDDLAERIGIPAHVIDVETVAELPRLPTGKIDYQSILSDAQNRRTNQFCTPTSIEEVFRAAFPRMQINRHSSFVSLGGDSLSYVLVAAEIEDLLGSLPRGWEEWPIARLETAEANGSRLRWTDSELLARAMAIVAIVINHASDFVVGGGAEALLMLVGFNWARFQRHKIAEGAFWLTSWQLVKTVIFPVYAITLIAAICWKWPGWPSIFFVSNFYGRYHMYLEPFWFMEALLQITLLMALVWSFRPVRHFATGKPLLFGIFFLAVGLASRWIGPNLFDHSDLSARTPDVLLLLPALGWCIYFCTTTRQRVVLMAFTLLIAAILTRLIPLPGLIAMLPAYRLVWLIGVTALLLFLPKLPLPSLFRKLVLSLASASFTIYIVHGIPIWLINRHFGPQPVLQIVTALIFGVLVHHIVSGIAARREPKLG